MSETIDVFVMGTPYNGELRSAIEFASNSWAFSVSKLIDIEFKFIPISPMRKPYGDRFPVGIRQEAFTCEGSEIFILTDSDMIPFSAEQVKMGINALKARPDFAILSAWPDPHDMISIDLPGRKAINDDEIMETYSVGGWRFCRKVPGLVAPEDSRKGYDGVFCRHLWDEHRMRVGYLKKSRAFHLGAHCTTLWKDD
jgi:hypothetical protein